MEHRIAFVGFRHGHIYALYDAVKDRSNLAVAACCEEDEGTQRELLKLGRVPLTHRDVGALLGEGDFDVVAVGDVYGKRGAVAAAALNAGKHVLSDKPICTRQSELDAIRDAAAHSGKIVGAMLDLRDSGIFLRVRELILGGAIGEVHAVYFNGSHPLLLGQRPHWYFEDGLHGGTINDLGIHAFDFIPWAVGNRWDAVVGARSWDTGIEVGGGFRNAAQVMLSMSNGCGVLGDLSYLVPDSFAYRFPGYWRFSFTGTRGVIEAALNDTKVTLFEQGATTPRYIEPMESRRAGYLDSFLRAIEGAPLPDDARIEELFTATNIALTCQRIADGT